MIFTLRPKSTDVSQKDAPGLIEVRGGCHPFLPAGNYFTNCLSDGYRKPFNESIPLTLMNHPASPGKPARFDPEFAITEARREFGEHGGVAPSIERSSTFTVM
jgi:hypothetical protein